MTPPTSTATTVSAGGRPDPAPARTSLHPNLRMRIGVGFVNRLVDSMITSFMAVYLAATHGPLLAGLLMIVVVGVGVAGMLAGGHLCEIRGRRPTLLGAEMVGTATYATMALAATPWWASPTAVYVAYLLTKLAASVALPANDAMIVDLSTPETRRMLYTVSYWVTNIALAIGALLGAAFYDGHFATVLAVAAGGTAVVALCTALFLTESRPAQPAAETSAVREFASGYRTVMADRLFLRLVLAGTLVFAVESQLVNHIAVRMVGELPTQQLFAFHGWQLQVDGVAMVGMLRAENTLLVVTTALLATMLLRRVPDRWALYLGTALFVGGYMVLAVSLDGWVLLAAGFVLTVGEVVTVPIRQHLTADLVPTVGRSRYLAVNNLTIRVGQGVAALCISLGALVPPVVMAGLYGAAGVVMVVQYRAVLAGRADRVHAS